MRVALFVDFELIVVAFLLLDLREDDVEMYCGRHLRRHLLQLLRQGAFGPIGLSLSYLMRVVLLVDFELTQILRRGVFGPIGLLNYLCVSYRVRVVRLDFELEEVSWLWFGAPSLLMWVLRGLLPLVHLGDQLN
jgi:hypothetical protein